MVQLRLKFMFNLKQRKMKKIIKMISVIILLTLFNQSLIAQCVSPCQALAGPDQNYCGSLCSSPVTLGASPHSSNPISTLGGCTATYSWAPSTGLSCTTCEHPLASPAVTTTYTLTVTFSGSCACDASNCNTCTRTDEVTITHTTCQHCKINNLLFDSEIFDICWNTYPKYNFNPVNLNPSFIVGEWQIPFEVVDFKKQLDTNEP